MPMTLNDKFEAIDKLNLSFKELMEYVNLCKNVCPLELLYLQKDGKLLRSNKFTKRCPLVGIIVGDYAYSLKVAESKEMSWVMANDWAKTISIGNYPAALPPYKEAYTLTNNLRHFNNTVACLQACGIDVDDLAEGGYFPCETDFPWMEVGSNVYATNDGWSSTTYVRDDIARPCILLKPEMF